MVLVDGIGKVREHLSYEPYDSIIKSRSDFKNSLSIKSSGFEETYCGSEIPDNLSLNGIVEVRFVSDGSMGTFNRVVFSRLFFTKLSVITEKAPIMTLEMQDFIFRSMWRVIHVTQILVRMMEFVKMENAHVAIAIEATFAKLKRIFANYLNA